jgi:plastocyanin
MRGESARGRQTAAIVGTAILVILLIGAGSAGGTGPQASQSAATATVKMREFAFRPSTVTVAPGTKVVFSNRDSVTHSAKRRGSFFTGRIAAGQSAAVRFKSSGTYAYHCTIHDFMRGKVVVR